MPFEFIASTWEFTHVDFDQGQAKSIGIGMKMGEDLMLMRLDPEEARRAAESILSCLGDYR